MRQGKPVERAHNFGLVFGANEVIVGSLEGFIRRIRDFVEQNFITALLPPEPEALLVSNAEEPASKFFIVPQASNVPGGGDERILDDVEACLFVMDQLKDINIKGQLVAAKERVPGVRISLAGLLNWQLFAFSHCRHCHPVECAMREKVQTRLQRSFDVITMPKMPTVAEQLRAAREAKKLTIEQVAESTKIRTDHIRALEEGNYDIFSAPIYIKGSVKNYATMLKLDVPKITADLDRELKGTANFSEPPPLVEQSRTPVDRAMFLLSKLNWKVGGVAALIVGIVVLFIAAHFAFQHLHRHKQAPKLPPAMYQSSDSGETLPLKH
jgi:transcriptional regulator with XRE-family HTH domain